MMMTEGGVTRVLRRYEFVIAAVGVIVLIVRLSGGAFIAHVAKGVSSAATAAVAPFAAGGTEAGTGAVEAAAAPSSAPDAETSFSRPAAVIPRSSNVAARQASPSARAVTTAVTTAVVSATRGFADGGALGESSVLAHLPAG